MEVRLVRQKLQRIRAGSRPPRVLDLFSGCGGLSLGFKRAGYDIAGAVEFDTHAAKSHGQNFHPNDARHSIARDITETPPAKLAEALGLGDASLAVDILVGGPPCQAFARVGRSKLREVAEHPEAFRHDARARLYIEYLRYVEACAPLAVVMENVPDMLNHGGHNLAEEIAEVLAAKGYVCQYSLLNAAFYGVPQMRERMILVAVHREVADNVSLPKPTHWIDLPTGYSGTRAVALKLLGDLNGTADAHHYSAPPVATSDLTAAVTAQEAIGDLPTMDARRMLAAGTLRRGRRAFDIAVPYHDSGSATEYARSMRSWPGFEGSSALYDHVIRYLPRDYQIFAGLKAGDQYPEALRYAVSLFEKRLKARRASGEKLRKGSIQWQALLASIVPPYDASKFPNKWRKMESDSPARTLLAHLGKDGYSHIHYDSDQGRPISVREAARLQSFPDGFTFSGTMNPAFRQIGNAVPPLFAWRIALALKAQLTKAGGVAESVRTATGVSPVSVPDLIIVRSLTDSDMGLFAAHRKATASRQRAIALTTPAAERLLHPDILRDNGGDFDCICLFGAAMNREIRRINKGGKNWRLGGGQLEHEVFRELDSKDFALIRSIPINDGSSPILLTFVGRRSHRLLQAGLASSLESALQHNVAIFEEDHDGFCALADLFPPIPARVAVRPATQQLAFL